MTIVEFLRARLDEDEAKAQAAQGASEFDGTGIVAGPRGSVVIPSQITAHIVRHDPARVLREVEAKRRIVDACAAADTPLGDEVLRLLAAPLADHPDYDPAWAPLNG